ncbi:MAG: hypothetical protein D6718_03625 [Acidobacteria bacterium]|nr:MAG: hypothetical protein D6718_03625 [Acidobacteriota bacterium]
MVVKTFRGRTAAEALAEAREALGADALVLETRRSGTAVEVVAAAQRPGARPHLPPPGERETLGRDAVALRDMLTARGFSLVLSERIAAAAQANLSAEQLADRRTARAYARDLLALILSQAPEAPVGSLVALVGPPGEGKTTTAAKIAARALYRAGRPVVLASADTRRLGGAEQMQAFARALGAPFRLVRDAGGIDEARRAAGPSGLVVVDTPGVARGDAEGIAALARLLESARRSEVELILAADRDAETLSDTVRRFEALRPGCLAVTRADETASPGQVVTAIARCGLPVRHVARGPEIPDDLEAGDPALIAAWALADAAEATP